MVFFFQNYKTARLTLDEALEDGSLSVKDGGTSSSNNSYK